MNSNRKPLQIIVAGSVNLDIVATAAQLPVAGETLLGAGIERYPGGKGANQALAARRLGAQVSLIAQVGSDGFAEEALTLLRQEEVNLEQCNSDPQRATGIALIVVAENGENQIVVGSGANNSLLPENIELPSNDAVICQLEVPMATVLQTAKLCTSFFCLNAAPAASLSEDLLNNVDLLIVNEVEAEMLENDIKDFKGLLAISYGSKGATLFKNHQVIAKSKPPAIEAVDTTACGDAFSAALTLKLVEGCLPQDALDFACVVGAMTATKKGAQTSLPTINEVESFLNPVD